MSSVLQGIQSDLVARLTASIPDARIMSAFDLDAARDMQIVAPAVFVSFDGLSIAEYSAPRNLARATVQFAVIVVARQGSAVTQGTAASASALGLFESVIGALTGYKPTGSIKPLILQSADAPEYTPPMAWLPSVWICETMLPTTP